MRSQVTGRALNQPTSKPCPNPQGPWLLQELVGSGFMVDDRWLCLLAGRFVTALKGFVVAQVLFPRTQELASPCPFVFLQPRFTMTEELMQAGNGRCQLVAVVSECGVAPSFLVRCYRWPAVAPSYHDDTRPHLLLRPASPET
jgi:hypothetical protein